MKKMIFGLSLYTGGLVFSGLIYAYVAATPYVFNGLTGLLASFYGTKMLIPFVISITAMLIGLCIMGIEAYKKSDSK